MYHENNICERLEASWLRDWILIQPEYSPPIIELPPATAYKQWVGESIYYAAQRHAAQNGHLLPSRLFRWLRC